MKNKQVRPVAKMKMADSAQDRAIKLQDMQEPAEASAANRANRETVAKWQLAKELAIHPFSQAILAGENPGLGANP